MKKHVRVPGAFRPCAMLVLGLAALALPGCISRVLEVKSDPPGAWVYLNGQELGTTPVVHQFDHYGTRSIVVSKQGHKPAAEVIHLRAPWWGWFPFDFFVELWPGGVEDRHEFSYELARADEVETDMDRLLKNLDELREKLGPEEQ